MNTAKMHHLKPKHIRFLPNFKRNVKIQRQAKNRKIAPQLSGTILCCKTEQNAKNNRTIQVGPRPISLEEPRGSVQFDQQLDN